MGLRYWLCPFDENNCGAESVFTVPLDESTLSISLPAEPENFSYNAVCRYEVNLPSEGVRDKDSLQIVLDEVANANVYVSSGLSYDSSEMAEVELEVTGGVYVLSPNKAFVTIVATDSNEPANFRLSATFTPYNETRL